MRTAKPALRCFRGRLPDVLDGGGDFDFFFEAAFSFLLFGWFCFRHAPSSESASFVVPTKFAQGSET
jgi:hypothetical protein